jgi:glutamate racemase
MNTKGAIGVFDSGYGGLTVLKEIVQQLPDYHYLYLGDNARSPYGTRTFETVYHYTLESVQWFFDHGCELVILACNTASAKALRTIQQNDLSRMGTSKRVLGVIRPTTEVIGHFSTTGQIGILGTKGTVQSLSYIIEIEKFFPQLKVFQEACPMWVPLIENNEYLSPGADYFIKKNLDQLFAQSKEIDTLLLACTHYPLLIDKLKALVPKGIQIIEQGAIVAKSLVNYLDRHPELESKCVKNSRIDFFTTDDPADFNDKGSLFFGKPIQSRHITLYPHSIT